MVLDEDQPFSKSMRPARPVYGSTEGAEPPWLGPLMSDIRANTAPGAEGLCKILARHLPGGSYHAALTTNSCYVSSSQFKGQLRISDHPKPGMVKRPNELYPSSYPRRDLPDRVDKALRAMFSGARSWASIPRWEEITILAKPKFVVNSTDRLEVDPDYVNLANQDIKTYLDSGWNLGYMVNEAIRIVSNPRSSESDRRRYSTLAVMGHELLMKGDDERYHFTYVFR